MQYVSKTFLCGFAGLLLGLAAPADARVVSAAEVNGTWRSESATFKVLALGRQRLKVEFSGTYKSGTTSNTGEASGIARIAGDTATFVPAGSPGCRITMKFRRARLVVDQHGECGFGLNVTADGTYTRRSRARPRFTD